MQEQSLFLEKSTFTNILLTYVRQIKFVAVHPREYMSQNSLCLLLLSLLCTSCQSHMQQYTLTMSSMFYDHTFF